MGYLKISAATAAALLALSAYSPAEAQTTPKRGGTVIVAIPSNPGAINPTTTSSVADQVASCTIYEGLVKISGQKIFPQLAKSWSISPDGKTYTFDLVKANWQDGKPFTSEDVKWALTEVNSKITPSFSAGVGRMLEGIDAPAPDKVVLRLKQPFGPVIRSLSCNQGGALLPKHIFEGQSVLTNPATKEKPVGTGPFKLAEWKQGDFQRLVRNDDYWQPGKPYLDTIIVKIIPQSTARVQALKTGEIDFIPYYFIPANDLAQFQNNPKYTIEETKVQPAQAMLFINLRKKPLDDKKVRQALLMATDRDYLIKNGWLGMGAAGTAPFTKKLTWAADPDIDYNKMYPFDYAKANAALDAAGYKKDANGTRFQTHILFPADETDFERVAVAIKSMWRNVGVDVVVDAFDRAITEKRAFIDSDFDTHINSYTSYGDPALGLGRIFLTSAIGKAYSNASGYSNPEVDRLFAEAEKGTSEEERGKIYRQAQKILADDLPVFTLREFLAYDVYSSNIQGLDNDAYLPSWTDAWLKN